MIVRLKDSARDTEIEAVLSRIGDPRRVVLPFGRFIIGMGRQDPGGAEVQHMPGVESVVAEMNGPVLAARDANRRGTVVPLGRTLVGGKDLAVIAGPCSVEDKHQLMTAARFVAAYGATALRGGAYKPRTSPYAFQGLRLGGLAILDEVKRATGLPVVTEAMEPEDVDLMRDTVDCIQVGARSMQNFPLLRAVGRAGKPVLLKRGPASSLSELMLAAEYVLVEGNSQVILCERGIRTFETATRNTLDLNAVPVLKSKTHLPVIVDPSHGTGRRDAVIPMARAAVAAGADGIIVEVHPDPDRALSDGDQSLTLDQFRQLMEETRLVAEAVGRRLSTPGAVYSSCAQRPAARTALGWGTT
ncbi:MAG: 3-deoxy-7-phosphoheptulonate synthase [Acidobacteriota bacterium]